MHKRIKFFVVKKIDKDQLYMSYFLLDKICQVTGWHKYISFLMYGRQKGIHVKP
jgi:hypothetical protein